MAFTPPSSGSGSGPSFPRPRPAIRERFQPPASKDEHRINERIRVPQVRLIDEKGNQVGIVPTQDALRMARERNLDLMEVSAASNPPVCKICDYGKFKYEKKKKEHEAKRKQTVVKVKEVQLRPNTDQHDVAIKLRNVKSFIEEGDKAKIVIMFRGREMAHAEASRATMEKMAEDLKDIAHIESFPKMEGRKLIMILAPGAKEKDTGIAPKKGVITPVSSGGGTSGPGNTGPKS